MAIRIDAPRHPQKNLRLTLTRALAAGRNRAANPALFLARGIRISGLATRRLGCLEVFRATCRQAVEDRVDRAIRSTIRQPSSLVMASQLYGRPRLPAGIPS